MTHPELVTNGMRLLMVSRRPTRPIAGLGPRQPLGAKQLEWCEQNLKAFTWPRAERLSGGA